jgi:predicted rRNA methylase YqxC with S4 and FtsJ domains
MEARRVMVNGIVAANPHTLVATDASVTLKKERTLRGTIKLRAALARFDSDVAGCAVAKAVAAVTAAAESTGWSVVGSMPAPPTGDARAAEVFVHARRVKG